MTRCPWRQAPPALLSTFDLGTEMLINGESRRNLADRSGDLVALEIPDLSSVADRDRLLALRRSGLLDSREEEAFDRLTHRACALLGVPVSLVSLVDADRQFFKSAKGLPEPAASARQTPLSHSFCQYVVAAQRPLVVSDARKVDFLADNPAIVDLEVIGYAGVPLHAHGYVLGAFCAIDSLAHPWSAEDIAVLEDLASACSTEIQLRVALRERRRAQAEQRFYAPLGPGEETAHVAPGSLPASRSQRRTSLRIPNGGDNHRWQRPELGIAAEAVI